MFLESESLLGNCIFVLCDFHMRLLTLMIGFCFVSMMFGWMYGCVCVCVCVTRILKGGNED